MNIAVDAMGGDDAPAMVIDGAKQAAARHPDPQFLFFGDREAIAPLLARSPALAGRAEIVHADTAIAPNAKPGWAVRRGRRSSMGRAIQAVKEGRADAVVSAGNTGALMAMAKVMLGMLPGISRPAIAAVLPSRRGAIACLDLGANIDCGAANLVDFAVMGALFAQTVLGRTTPTVGLLNASRAVSEDRGAVNEAAAILRRIDRSFLFHGMIDGKDIMAGTVDVVVTDGFAGNVALKMAEGSLRVYAGWLRDALSSSWRGKIGYVLARGALRAMRVQIDPRQYNGAILLGLNGTVVKSHGGIDAFGFAMALDVGIEMYRESVNRRIIAQLVEVHESESSVQPLANQKMPEGAGCVETESL